MRRRPPPPCPACPPGASACWCWVAEADADRAAAAWAAAHGVKLEREDRAAGLGGDAFPDRATCERIAANVERTRLLRDYREFARVRVDQIDRMGDDRRVLEFHVVVLDAYFDDPRGRATAGAELQPLEAIARRFGRKSHSWASERMAEIFRAALELPSRHVGKRCKRPRCGKTVERVNQRRGREPEYCDRKCAHAHAQAMYQARKAMGVPGPRSIRN